LQKKLAETFVSPMDRVQSLPHKIFKTAPFFGHPARPDGTLDSLALHDR
jgi:hypothetical protein